MPWLMSDNFKFQVFRVIAVENVVKIYMFVTIVISFAKYSSKTIQVIFYRL